MNTVPQVDVNQNINITADSMDYYPDTYEIHAIGNAKLDLKAQRTKIYADKIVFNYDIFGCVQVPDKFA